MSIEIAERLKSDLTDKYVVVANGVPELRRFADRTGIVKTVNMNGRALVEFQGFEDIGWYDIDPSYLKVVPAPAPGKPAAPAHEPKAAATTAEKKPVEKKAGLSPLEMARQQGAAGAKPAAPAAAKSGLSPLELARQQGAAKAAAAGGAAPAAPAQKAAPAAEGGKKLSPLELARQQGAAKSGGAAPPAPAAKTAAPEKPAAKPAAEPAPAPKAAAPAPAPTKPATTSEQPTGTGAARTQSILELARKQGPAKG